MDIYCIVPMYKDKFKWEDIGLIQQNRQAKKIVVMHDDMGVSDTKTGGNVILKSRFYRNYAAKNIYDAILLLRKSYKMQDDDIICIIDGDDKLYDSHVLDTIYRTYRQYKCLLTYGSYYKMSVMERGGQRKLYRGRYRTGQNFRKEPWRASHLKTFKYGLFKHLPGYALRDKNRQWLKVASDLALMFPLMEMAGHSRIRHIDKPLYIYNDLSDMNDHKVAGGQQLAAEKWLREQEGFKRI